MMVDRTLFLIRSLWDQRCLDGLQGESDSIGDIHYGKRSNLDTTLHRLSGTTPELSNMGGFLATFRKIRGVISHNQLLRTSSQDKFGIESSPIKCLFHLVTVCLFIILPVPCNVNKVVFAAEPHVKYKKMLNKFLSRLGYFTNLCYYCSDKAYGFIEKHLVLEFWTTTKQMLFSLGFSQSYNLYEHAIVKFILKSYRSIDLKELYQKVKELNLALSN